MTDNLSQPDAQETNQPRGWGPWQAIGVGLGAFLGAQVLIGVVISLYLTITGQEFETFFNSDSVVQLFSLSLMSALFGSLILFWFVRKRGGLKELGYTLNDPTDLLKAIPAYFVYFIGILLVFALVGRAAPSVNLDQEQVVGFEEAAGNVELVISFISLVIVAPFFEETLFRGFAFRGIASKWGFWAGAVLSSAVFGIAHGQINVGIDTFVLGMVACSLVYHTKSIWPAILLHGIKNAVAFMFIFIIGN